MKISVIIPIYKAEKYIERCVRSLMEQTIEEDIEFIFINDCTPDNTLIVLNKTLIEYPHRLQQIRILHNPFNMGPHNSRLRGINEAKGDYIGFCDADDWISPTMYKKMLNATDNCTKDIIVSNYIEEKKTGDSTFTLQSFEHPHDALANMHNWHKFSWAMWNQLIRREIIKEEIQHIYPTKFREDTYLMMRCYFMAKSIAYIPEALYHYNLLGTESLIHTRKLGYDGWKEQKENIERISSLIFQTKKGRKKFHFGINNFKFMIKKEYEMVFPSEIDFYYAFRECHNDAVINYYKQSKSIILGFKMWLVYCTNYAIYSTYKRTI